MKLTFTQEADYRRERDFGAKLNATFEFIGAQFRPLLKSLLYFVLPGALLFGVGMGLLFGNFGSLAAASRQGVEPRFGSIAVSSLTGAVLTGLGGTVAFLLVISVLYSFVRVRLNTPPAEQVHPAQVWAYLRPRLGRVLLTWLLFGVGGIGLTFGLAVAFVGLAAGSGNEIGTIWGMIGALMLLSFFFMWLAVNLALYFPILLIEDVGIGTAIRRSFYLVRGKWWSTFGLLMIASLIQSFIAYIFAIPMYVVMFAQMLQLPLLDSPLVSVITGCIYAVGTVLTYIILLSAIQFQYFNLVERKEGTGLRQLVDRLGQTPTPQVSGTYYQPDEEGEY